MLPNDQPTVPTRPPDPSRSSPPGVWVAPSVEELQAKLPQYEVLEILGRGGMGAVYKARQKSLKRLVAIKILPLGMADDEFKFVERFENEAQTMAQMNHPAIVAVHDFGETSDGLLYFVMEFVDGTDVHKMIQASGRLSGEYALAITAHVCDALSYAHKRGVIHRDIKPANILIDQEGHIKVADFGLAKMHDPAQTSGLTRTNMAMGTPDYVAPEVLVTGMVADHRADIYAVGVMLYQMLTGEVPRGLFKLPSQKGIGSDERFDAIICKAMEQDRDERYQSAMDVRRDLDVILTTPQPKSDGTGVVPANELPQKPVAKQPRPPGQQNAPAQNQPPAKGAAKQAPEQKPAAAAKAKAPPKKQSPAAMWMSIGGIVAVLGVAGFFVFGGRPKTVSYDAADFAAQVAAAPAEQQVELVVKKIEALNGSAVTVKPTIVDGVVTGINLGKRGLDSPRLDLSPVAALRHLTMIHVYYLYPRDISFLRGMKVEKLVIHGGNFAVDVLRELPLTNVEIRSGAADMSVLAGKPLTVLDLSVSPLRDISFVKGMPLTKLVIDQTAVKDLSPIRGLPLKEIKCIFVPERDTEILRSIPTLTRINDQPAEKFWASVGVKATAHTVAEGKTIDLLPLVDVKRDAIAGEWARDGDDLVVNQGNTGPQGTPRLQLPYQPPEEYDFEVEFTPKAGTNLVAQVVSAQQHSFAWMLDAILASGNKAGFDRIDGQGIASRANGTTIRKSFLENGRRHRSTVEVRRNEVRGLLDGEVIVKWGKNSDCYKGFESSPPEAMRDPLHLGLAVRERAVRFHKITVREISGGGTLEAGGATSITSAAKAAAPERRTIDLLPLVDVKRDALAGDWSRDGMDLLVQAAKSDSSGSPRLQLPYQPPEEYDFEIEFTPESGTNSVSQLLSAYQRTFAWQVDVKLSTGMKAGFAQIGGKSLIGTTDGNVMRPSFLTNGRRHRSTVEVRRTGLRGLLDGQQVVSWGANPESYQALDIHPNDALRDALHLGIGGYDRAVRFHKITVREITGTGKVDALPAGIVPASASGNAPPNFTTWKDVTTEMRDRARGVAGVVVEADAVRIAPGATSTPVIPITTTGMRDCAVRLRHAGGGQVNLRVNPDGFLFVLCQRDQTIFKRYDKAAPTSAVIAPSALHPAGFDYEARHETIVTIDGSTIRAWVDGRFVGEAQDTKFPTGTVGLALMPSTAIYQVEIADLTPSPAAAAPVANSEMIDWLKRDVWSAPFVLENGVLKSTKDAVMPIGTMGDGTIRMRLRDVGTAVTSGAPSLQIKVRSTPLATDKWGNYQLQIFPGRSTCNLIYIDKNLTTGVESTDALWKDKPLRSVPGHPKEFEFEFRTEGETLSVSAGGQTVASVRDSRLSTGTISIVSNPTIEITRFETVGATNSKLAAEVSANTPPTPTAGWQDVTSTMREKLRSKPGISVEANEVRRTSNDGAVVNAKLSDETTRDRVLRVRFTHNVQVSLWSATGPGSVAVLVLSNRTIFQRQVTATGSAERFGPDMPHPNGYDVLQPHELIVALQGSTVRAWLNGRFTGEARDDLIEGRFFGLGFFPQTAVQKVEIAEVNAATETSNLQWTDWLGPKLASGQSLPAGWKVDGSGVTTDKPIGGTNVVQDVKDAAVRVSYDLRDSQGIQITMRESKADGSRDMYFADDTGDTLYIARLKGTEVKSFSRRDYPPGTPRTGNRTLEFRCVGDRLEATVTGAAKEPITLTATDASLVSGPCAVVLKKGVLLTKVEVQNLGATK